MAEIILASSRTHQEQMREILDLATELEIGHGQVTWAPRPGDLPHGGLVVVPDELAAAYFDTQADGPDEVSADADTKTKTRTPAKKAAAKAADSKE